MKMLQISIDTAFRTCYNCILVRNAVSVNAKNTENYTLVTLNKRGGTALGTLYENIIALCTERGIKGGKMCTDIGMSKGILTDLKMGRQTGISAANAQKIAAYFGVTVGYLLGEEEKEKPTTQEGDGLSEDMKELIERIKTLPEDKIQLLLQLAKSIE